GLGPAPLSEPDPGRGEAGGAALDELVRFYARNGDVLEYFGPEAVEHLETITHSLLALQRGASPDAEVATLFRAFHTLKGAAYTVGCRPIGDFAHRVEDLLVAVREGRLSFTPTTVEAVFATADAVRLMLAVASARPPGLEAAVARAGALVGEGARRPPGGGGGGPPGGRAAREPTPAAAALPSSEAMAPAVAAWSGAPSARA